MLVRLGPRAPGALLMGISIGPDAAAQLAFAALSGPFLVPCSCESGLGFLNLEQQHLSLQNEQHMRWKKLHPKIKQTSSKRLP